METPPVVSRCLRPSDDSSRPVVAKVTLSVDPLTSNNEDPKEKLADFRIKELKDVLSRVGVSKQGRKQDLVDRIVALLYDDGSQGMLKNVVNGKEELVQIIGDVYRQMQEVVAKDASVKKQSSRGTSTVTVKQETQNSRYPMKMQCPCGSALPTDPLIQCEDPDCKVWQHVSCVFIPDNPMETLPSPSQFFCEICRLKRADPFWETLGHPVYPVKLAASNVLDDSGNPLQRVETTFQLTKAENDSIKKIDFDVQAWCILLNDNVPFRIQWPQHADLQVNGSLVRTVNRPGSQMLGANGRDDGARISVALSEGVNKISLSACDARIFCFGIRLAKRRTLQQVLNMIPKEAEGESLEFALARVQRCIGGGIMTGKEGSDSDNDVEVIADAITVNLRCPISGARMKTAGRFKPCVHMGCFDLETLIKLNERSRKWQCPICLKNYSLEDLIVDPYFNRIATMMRKCGEETDEIDVKPDCCWRVKKANEFMDLAMWHHPDGEVMPSLVSSKLDEQEHKSREYTPKLEIQSHATEPQDIHLFYNNDESENFDRNVITMSSTDTGDGEHDGVPSINQNCSEQVGILGNNENEVNSEDNNCGPANGTSCQCSSIQDVVILSDSDEDEVSLVFPKSVSEAFACRDSKFYDAPQTPGACSALDTVTMSTVCNGSGDDFPMPEALHGSNITAGSFRSFSYIDATDSVPAVDLEQTSVSCSGPFSSCSFSSEFNVNPGCQVLNPSVFLNNAASDNGLIGNNLGSVDENVPLQGLPLAQSSLTMQLPVRSSGDVENQVSLRLEASETGACGSNIESHPVSACAHGTELRRQLTSTKDSLLPNPNSEPGLSLKWSKKRPRALFSCPRQPRSPRRLLKLNPR
ncbi:hypothetical protein Dimus_011433 [Dionaea muscipula]